MTVLLKVYLLQAMHYLEYSLQLFNNTTSPDALFPIQVTQPQLTPSKASWMKERWWDQWKAAEPSRLSPSLHQGSHRCSWPAPPPPEDSCGTFWCTRACVDPLQTVELSDDQLLHIPATEWWSWLNWPRPVLGNFDDVDDGHYSFTLTPEGHNAYTVINCK